ncbi:hypothetical protein PQX77_005274 [Marasmius sp. AFHP31]|nr:hypothetical protein PQX77_005274 [Marasmius sp. AFHP31]
MSIRSSFLKGGYKAAAQGSSDQLNSHSSSTSTSSSSHRSNSSRAASIEVTSNTSDASDSVTGDLVKTFDSVLTEPNTPTRPLSGLSRHGGFDQVNLDGSISPTPPVLPNSFVNLRKHSTADLLDDTPRMTKQIKEHTDKVCNDANLNTPQREAVQRFSKLDDRQRQITFFAEMQTVKGLCGQRAEQEKNSTDLRLKDKLAEVKSKVSTQITVCLLLPDISFYIHNINEAIMALISKEPELFKATRELLDNQEHYASLRSYVVTQVSQTRSTIKAKLYASMGTQKWKKGQQTAAGPQTINMLATTLASTIQGMEVGGAHWARFAYLRLCCAAFDELLKTQKGEVPAADPAADQEDDASVARPSLDTTSTTSRKYRDTEYWKFVDHELAELRAGTLEEAHGNRKVAAVLLGQFFTRVLQEDLQFYNQFPSGETITINDVDYTPVGAPWQKAISQAMVFPAGSSTV